MGKSINETIGELMDYYRSNGRDSRFRLDDYANAYNSNHALMSILHDHAKGYDVREHFIDEFREVYGMPHDVICAVDCADYNDDTSRGVATSIEKNLRNKIGQQGAKAVAKKFQKRTYTKSDGKRVMQLMDNGEMFVVIVDSGKVLSHFVAGPSSLARMKRTFDKNEADAFAEQKSGVHADIDKLIDRMNKVRSVKFPRVVVRNHGGHNVGCDFDNIDWAGVKSIGSYDKFLRPSLEECGLVPKLDPKEEDAVVKTAVESIRSRAGVL